VGWDEVVNAGRWGRKCLGKMTLKGRDVWNKGNQISNSWSIS